jgi:hypothetical protein
LKFMKAKGLSLLHSSTLLPHRRCRRG